jgi:hypothetical protein
VGYDLHITRAEHWTEAAQAPITAEEWLAVVRADPEWTLEPANGPYFALWASPDARQPGWLDWHDGALYTKAPDSALLRKMVTLATQLGAHVQGDDGERYDGTRPWWRRLFGN